MHGQRRSTTKTIADSSTGLVQATDASPTISFSPSAVAYHDITKNLGLDNLAGEIDESTPILNDFIAVVQKHFVHTDTCPQYTLNLDAAESVFDMPLYDPQIRHYEL